MLLKYSIIPLLVISFSIIATDGQLIQSLWQANPTGLERHPSGINLSSRSRQCEPMTFSLPRPETGCCGLHKFDETTFNAGIRRYKRNLKDVNMTNNDNDSDITEDEANFEHDYNSYELESDTFSEPRQKRKVIEGFQNPPSKFIVAGRTADISFYPWMVRLEIFRGGRQISFCGGSLINSKYVLTARHCVQLEFESLNDIKVVLAEYDVRTEPTDCVNYGNGQQQCIDNVVMYPEQIIIHPHGHDIAMIRLRGIAPYSEFIRPICLPPFNIDTPHNRDLELVVAGWGSIYEGSPGYPVKLSTTVNLVPLDECRRLSPVPSETLCAIGSSGQDACHGDSGGPLMSYYDGNYILVGVVSGKYVANARCGSRVPTSYVNVHLYLNWIQSVITPY